MIAVVVVRDGVLPAGSDEAVCEAERCVLLVGSGLDEVVGDISRFAMRVWTLRTNPAAMTAGDLAGLIAACLRRIAESPESTTRLDQVVVLPASPDGRDLAPRLAFVLDRPFHAGAVSITSGEVTVARHGGLHLVDVVTRVPFVATLQIGVRGSEPHNDSRQDAPTIVDLTPLHDPTSFPGQRSVQHIDVQPPDASTMDLAEAPRILGGGAGLSDAEAFDQLHMIATRLEASMGVTRVITDRGWADHTRQIGTTGVVVDPELYISFGISGAVQHTSGLGHPHHIVSVNTDPHCPMMQISDVAIVSDANDVLDALESILESKHSSAISGSDR